METVTDFIFLGSRITEDSYCNHYIKGCLFSGRKAMTNLDSVSKSRDITLLTKVCIVKAGPYSQNWSISSSYWFFQQLCTDVRAGQ